MNIRKWPLGLTLFSGTAFALVVAVSIIPIPVQVAMASQFSNPTTVQSYSKNAVSSYTQAFIKFVEVFPIMTLRNGLPAEGYLFADLRTGKQVRIARGDLLPVKFADGSTMHLVFMGVPKVAGYYFHPVPGTFRAPGVPMYQPIDKLRFFWLIGSDVGGTGGGFVNLGGGSSLTYTSGGASCISGNVGMCDRPPQMAAF